MCSELNLPKVILGQIFWWVPNTLNRPSCEKSGRVCERSIYPPAREENAPSKANKWPALQGRQPKSPVCCPTEPTWRTITSYLCRISKCLRLRLNAPSCLRSLVFVLTDVFKRYCKDQCMFKMFNIFHSVQPRLWGLKSSFIKRWSIYLRTWVLIPGQRWTCGPAAAAQRHPSAPLRPLLTLPCQCCYWRSWHLSRRCWTSFYKPEPGAFTPDTGMRVCVHVCVTTSAFDSGSCVACWMAWTGWRRPAVPLLTPNSGSAASVMRQNVGGSESKFNLAWLQLSSDVSITTTCASVHSHLEWVGD